MPDHRIDMADLIARSDDESLRKDYEEMLRVEVQWIASGDESKFDRWKELTSSVHARVHERFGGVD